MFCKNVIKKPYMFRSLSYDHPQGLSFVLIPLPLLRLFVSSFALLGVWLYVSMWVCGCMYLCECVALCIYVSVWLYVCTYVSVCPTYALSIEKHGILFSTRRNFKDHFIFPASYMIPKSNRAELEQQCKMLVLDKSWVVCYNHATHTNILVIAKDVENTKLYGRWNVFLLAYCWLKFQPGVLSCSA
jgi:hypothetical protein